MEDVSGAVDVTMCGRVLESNGMVDTRELLPCTYSIHDRADSMPGWFLCYLVSFIHQ